jgi:hypothetical protein
LETVKTFRTAFSNRSASVLPGTSGAGRGFICLPVYPLLPDVDQTHF